MPPVGFEPTISVGERPQTYALDRAATGQNDTPKVRNYKHRPIHEKLFHYVLLLRKLPTEYTFTKKELPSQRTPL